MRGKCILERKEKEKQCLFVLETWSKCQLYRLFHSASTCWIPNNMTEPSAAYWGSAAQASTLVTEMLCPLHLRTPASHSDIVCSSPFTSMQMLIPCSWHSDACRQTHLLLWAGKVSKRGLIVHHGGG